MLSEKERRRCEKMAAQGWVERIGLDWFYLVVGIGFLVAATLQGAPQQRLLLPAVGGFALGGSLARLFLAKDQELLARLYREQAGGPESAPQA